jgi:hypothetical protein
MTFEFLIAIEVKNNEATHETSPEELTAILAGAVLENDANDLPWVLSQDISVITRDLRE